MAKIVISHNGTEPQEIRLGKERTTMGRRVTNDIVIVDPTVSGEHAVIAAIEKELLLQDLDSTNGTYVNGQPITKHVLRHADVIEIGQHKLTFFAESVAIGAESTPASQPTSNPVSSTADAADLPFKSPAIEILDGPNAGKLISLARPITTIGRMGREVAAITAGQHGYGIARIEGSACPMVNGTDVKDGAQPLRDGDVIEFFGVKARFLSSSVGPKNA